MSITAKVLQIGVAFVTAAHVVRYMIVVLFNIPMYHLLERARTRRGDDGIVVIPGTAATGTGRRQHSEERTHVQEIGRRGRWRVRARRPAAFAQQYPTKPVTVVVPFTPGGSSDITARTVSAKLQESLGQSFVIDNKPGANGSLGGKFVANAAPDGYTLFVGSIGVFAINQVLYKDLGYDTAEGASTCCRSRCARPTRWSRAPNFPANTLQEFVDYVKKNPGKVSFASSGTGSSDHLTAALFWQKTGTTGIHVPVQGRQRRAPGHHRRQRRRARSRTSARSRST